MRRISVRGGGIGLVLLLALATGSLAGGQTGPAPSCWPGEPGTDPGRCPPDDPDYETPWDFQSGIPDSIDRERMHPAEVALGSIGFSADAAWQLEQGRDDVVIAVLDSGILWRQPDLVRKLYLNRGELPEPEGGAGYDRDGNGVFDVDDYAADSRVGDRNGNGLLDPEDLILAFSDCADDDANGYPDDICGYDFFGGAGRCGFAAGDNDPRDDTEFGHGTGIASTAAAETNNGIGDAGVCPRCRLLPVRVGDSFVVDANRFARGVAFAVNAGASVIASALGSYNNTPSARWAVDLAYRRGVPVIASAADEFSYHHNFPSVLNHTVYVNAIRYNDIDDYTEATTFWGLNPCTNFGARVWITVPAVTCSSGATARLAGVAGLVESAARRAGLGDLEAEELYQVLRASADDLDNRSPDWGSALYTARAGFDQLYGYGRLNALRAVRLVREARVPPVADLDDPSWFAVISPRREPVLEVRGTIRLPRARSATYRLEYAPGVEPAEPDYVRVAAGETERDLVGRLGLLDFRRLPRPGGPPPAAREDRDRYSVTLRLRVTDERGLTAEARRSFFVFDDPTWVEHFPLDLGASGEAGPVLADLDGDGRDEIVLPTADGLVRVLRWTAAGVRTLRLSLDESPPIAPGGPVPRETVLRAAAIGDLRGDAAPEIVVASREGAIYAFDARGERLPGFPVRTGVVDADAVSAGQVLERGLLSRPVLADLDGAPGLEIVASGLDGRVYAWRGDGRPLPGFPVALAHAGLGPGHLAKSVSTPAVGDIDGDGRPEIVLGSNGLREGLAGAYAVRARGTTDPRGPFLAGWQPFELPGVRPDLLPTLATGVQMEPALVDEDGDGDSEVVLYAVTGSSILLVDHEAGRGPRIVHRYSLSPGPGSRFRDTYFLAGTGSPLVADTDGDGEGELYAPLLPFRMLTLRTKPGVPLDVPLALGGWSVRGNGDVVRMLDGYPRRMEDLMIFARPAAADVDGDGRREVLMGSGGYLLHAFARDGAEAAGFPKFTGGWIFSAPATGDLDGDGRAEVVSVTREGYLFAWRAGGRDPPSATRRSRPADSRPRCGTSAARSASSPP